MATFTAAAIQSAFADIAIDLNVSIHRATYLTSLVIAILGVAPLVWRPLSERYGRRPIFLISLIGSLVCNIGCACSPTYATMGLCRALAGFFISPAAALGSATVTETFFKRERARYMGIWTVMVTLGVPTAPVIFGFVAYRVGYRWIYWILACVSKFSRFKMTTNPYSDKCSTVHPLPFLWPRVSLHPWPTATATILFQTAVLQLQAHRSYTLNMAGVRITTGTCCTPLRPSFRNSILHGLPLCQCVHRYRNSAIVCREIPSQRRTNRSSKHQHNFGNSNRRAAGRDPF
jgi:MFS family permease